MDHQELNKLLSDVAAHYKQDIGEHFAKAIGWQIADLPWEEQKRELLTIIAQLVDELITSQTIVSKGHYE